MQPSRRARVNRIHPMKKWTLVLTICLMTLCATADAYSVIAVDQIANSYEDGKLQTKISRGIVRYEINPLTRSITVKEAWVESFPDKVSTSNDRYSIIATDDPVPVSDIPKLRQKVIHALNVDTMQVGTLKNSHPTLLVIGENYFKRIYYNNGLVQLVEGDIIPVTAGQAKEISLLDYRQFQKNEAV